MKIFRMADVEKIGNLLSSEFAKEEWKNLKIYLGYQLSYPQEWVRCLTVDELCKLMNRDHNDGWQDSLQNSLQEDPQDQLQDKPEEGLYAGMLINEQPKKHRLTPGYPDDVYMILEAEQVLYRWRSQHCRRVCRYMPWK